MTGNEPRVVIDTNILFSALLGRSASISRLLFHSGHRFVICETALVELFKHRERIAALSSLTPDNLLAAYHRLLRRLELYKEDLVGADDWAAAMEYCAGIDMDDVPHVAVALAAGGVLWTGDQRLRRGLEARGFTRFFDPET